MNITIITDAWAPQVNGVVRTLGRTVQTMAQRGHNVRVIDPGMFNGIGHKSLPGLRLALPPYRMADALGGDAGAIHIATEGPLGLAAKIYCDRRGIPYTTAFHTNFPAFMADNYRIPKALTYAFVRWFHRLSKAVMVPTQSMIDELEANGFTNCVHWGRGVDTGVFHLPAADAKVTDLLPGLPRPYWLSVGRVSKEKNLAAFLSLDLPGTKIVVGAGPDRDRLSKLYPQTQFLGEKHGADLAVLYQAADVFVFPSRFDTFGLVNAEAIACGTPVAAFPVTGPRDIIVEGVTGCLNEDLRVACLDALTLKDVSGDFSWEKATDQFLSYLVARPI